MLVIPVSAFDSYLFQCDGGRPCAYCLKKSQECVSQVVDQRLGTKFVYEKASLLPSGSSPVTTSGVPHDNPSLYLKQFFSDFLVTNDFGSGCLNFDALRCFQECPSLYHSLLAIGALDFSRKRISPVSQRKSVVVEALKAYTTSVSIVNDDLTKGRFLKSDMSLWTTFFLGIFEVSLSCESYPHIQARLFINSNPS